MEKENFKGELKSAQLDRIEGKLKDLGTSVFIVGIIVVLFGITIIMNL